jgi:sortase A
MAGRSSHSADEENIPLGIVFMVVGLIIVLTVVAIWIMAPAKMPGPLYAIAGRYLPQAPSLPQRLPLASVPKVTAPPPTAEPVALLPETPLEAEFPAHFVSAADVENHQPLLGQPTRIVIPRISVDAPVSAIGLGPIESDGETYYQWQVPNEYKVGWHNNSAPLDRPGNTVLNGHHNIFGEVFRDLVDLNEGDQIILYDNQRAYSYQVSQIELFPEHGQPLFVRMENAKWIGPTDDERVTLVTCWPYTDNSHRLVVVAHPLSNSDS